MVYKPHLMQARTQGEPERDSFGRILSASVSDWRDVCRCRCDHSTDVEIKTEDGSLFRPQFRVVCEGNRPDVNTGDHIRILEADGSVKAEGKAYPTKRLNYLPYAEVYIKS